MWYISLVSLIFSNLLAISMPELKHIFKESSIQFGVTWKLWIINIPGNIQHWLGRKGGETYADANIIELNKKGKK